MRLLDINCICMIHKVEKLIKRYNELVEILSDPNIAKDRNRFHKLSKEQSDLSEIVSEAQRFESLEKETVVYVK